MKKIQFGSPIVIIVIIVIIYYDRRQNIIQLLSSVSPRPNEKDSIGVEPILTHTHSRENGVKSKKKSEKLLSLRVSRLDSSNLLILILELINERTNSFPVRVMALWNRLPEYVVMASRLTTFKRLLRTVNMSYTILGKS